MTWLSFFGARAPGVRRLTAGVLAAALLLCLPLVTAQARESAAVASPRAIATLVSDTDTIQPGQPFRVGLRLRMADGWHTYWKNPGDAGMAPELTIDNAKASAIDWPTPRRIAEGTVMTYAYTGEVLLPVTVTAAPGVLKAHAQWLVCKDICVPEEGDFTLDLAAGPPTSSAQAATFAAHDKTVPRPSPWPAHISGDGILSVQGPELTPATVTDAWFIPDQGGQVQDDAAQPLSVHAGGFTLALKLAHGFKPKDGLAGLLSIRDRSGTQADVTIRAEPGEAPLGAPSLPRVLLFAFLGGAILNLMPCVFPILAMKAVALARHAAPAQAAAYGAGVLVTFVALAGVLLAARAAGVAAGWGFQFSSPAFVAAMTWLLFGVGLNLSGVFEIGGGITGLGGHLAQRKGLAGSFFTGLLAVLVATPCTAPFMGVAVAAGLAAAPAVTVLVFATMGLGLAAPYVAIASIPGLTHILPKPGGWMTLFKQVLAFPMYGAAAWLLWVVSQEAGSAGVLAVASGIVLVGFAAWVAGATQMAAGRSRRAGQVMALLALAGALAVLPGLSSTAAPEQPDTAETFSPARLEALRAQGKPVFVNMTAAWCVTCLVNERVAIQAPAVRQAFAAADVAYLKGDWTRQDPAITEFLRRNGRDGVPLYVFFPAGGAPPEVLPQILTQSDMLRLLRAS